MSHAPNPYAPFPGEAVVEPRTSVLAILALISSLVCFIPGLSLVGVLLAIIALITISGSNGRTGGRGLAIAALVIGLVVSALWGAIALGISQVGRLTATQYTGPIAQVMTTIETKDYAKARNAFTAPAAARLTDADFDRFIAAYQAELGSFKGGPDGFLDLMQSLGSVGQQMQQFQNKPGQQTGVIPFPGKFDKGIAVIALQIDTNNSTAGSALPNFPVANIMIILPSGTKVVLYDPQAAGALTPVPAGSAAPAVDPAQPVEDPVALPETPEPTPTPPPGG
jgi:hypothetical protein